MHPQRLSLSISSSVDSPNINNASASNAPQYLSRSFREGDEEDSCSGAPGQQVFYTLSLKEITNALLVPAGIMSTKLQPSAPILVGDAPPPLDLSGGGNLASAMVATPVPAASSARQQRHIGRRSTVKASLFCSPRDTCDAEDALVIGSVTLLGSSVGDRGVVLCDSPAQRQGELLLQHTGSWPTALVTHSVPQSLLDSPQLSLQQSSDVTAKSSSRSIAFFVGRSSRDGFAFDGPLENREGLESQLLASCAGANKKGTKKKSVHFPENVIKSVSVVQAEDQLRLLVKYNRPWYVYFVLLFACIFFVLGWSFIALAIEPSEAKNRIAACSVISFVAFGFASVYLLAFLVLTWRPGSDELDFLLDFSRNRSLVCVLVVGVAAQLFLVGSFMFTVNVVIILCFCSIPLVVTYLYEEYKLHSVSILDGIGSILVVGSIVFFCIGANVEEDSILYRRILPVFISVAGGVAMAFFLFQVRTVSQYISNFFVMCSTITLTTLVLAAVTYIVDGFSVPITSSYKKLTDISSKDFLNIILGALFFFFSWFTYHWSSLFFDRMTLSGSFSFGSPIAIIIFYLLSLPAASLPYELAGGVAMAVGCGLVLFSGFRFRQNVEVRIELERE